MREGEYAANDAYFAVTSAPELALQLTYEPGRWRVMVFDLASKAAAIAGHYEPTLEAAKRFVVEFVEKRYGVRLEGLSWKEALRKRGYEV
jgi:hypothetical protein